MEFSFYEVGMKQPSQVLVCTQAVGANIPPSPGSRIIALASNSLPTKGIKLHKKREEISSEVIPKQTDKKIKFFLVQVCLKAGSTRNENTLLSKGHQKAFQYTEWQHELSS